MKRKRKPVRKPAEAAEKSRTGTGHAERVLSVTDYVCMQLQRALFSDPGSMDFSTSVEQRELTLLSGLTVAVIERELELLKAEALEGKCFAIEALHRIASQSTNCLALLAARAPDLVKPIAQHESVWPVPYSNAARHKKFATKMLSDIDLGSRLKGSLDANNVLSEDTVARRLLFTLTRSMERIRVEALRHKEKDAGLTDVKEFMDSIKLRIPPEAAAQAQLQDLYAVAITPEENDSLKVLLGMDEPLKNPHTVTDLIDGSAGLPELTPEAIDAWLQVIKQFLMDACEGHPENSALRTLGIFQAASGSGSYESNVRTGIWVRLKTTLERIAEAPGKSEAGQR